MPSVFARTLRTYAEREELDLDQVSLSSIEVEELPVQKQLRPRAIGSPLTTGTSLTKKQEAKPEEIAKPAEPIEEKKAPAQPISNGLLSRGWAWLKKNHKFTAAKQMRVSETISLGEKRFVSVIHVDGQKFLIGGGAQGVTLLTELAASQTAADALQTIANAGEKQK